MLEGPPSLKGKFVLVSGSAGRACPEAQLDTAIEFLRCFTREVLSRGGGFVILGSDEDSTKDERGIPRIFDWVVLREVEAYAGTTTESPRLYAFVVMSDEAVEKKIGDANLRLLQNLEQRRVLQLHHIQRERFTGGEYRKAQVQRAHAMVGIGGGKGTYSAGTSMAELGKAVLPLDLKMGSPGDDAGGAMALHRELLLDPSRFFPYTHEDLVNRIGLIGLNRGITDVEAAARAAVEMFEREFDATPQLTWRTRAAKPLARLWEWTKAVPAIIKNIESIVRSFN